MFKVFVLLIALFATGCTNTRPFDEKFEAVSGEFIAPSVQMGNNRGLVMLYLSPECPLCQNYTVAINDIITKYRDSGFAFMGVVSGDFYPRDEILKYQVRYDLDLRIIQDPEFKLAKYYDAKITPEAHLIDRDGNVIYRGAIDNWAISLGQKRRKPTAHYLASALNAFSENREIDPKETKPVGCFIE